MCRITCFLVVFLLEKIFQKDNHSLPHEVLTVKMKMSKILIKGGIKRNGVLIIDFLDIFGNNQAMENSYLYSFSK